MKHRVKLHIFIPDWCGIGAIKNMDFQKTHKIKVFKEDIHRYEIRDCRTPECRKEYII